MRGALISLLLVGACASDPALRKEPLPPLTEAQAQLFDDGVDLMEDPAALEGRWYDEWSQDLERRLSESDEVVVGTVRTVRADVDLSRRTSYRVVFAVERVLRGKPGKELTLASREGAVGYSSMERYRQRLLERRFVAFIKRAGDESAPDVRHFHLTPPSPQLDQRLERFEADQRPQVIKVIEHSH